MEVLKYTQGDSPTIRLDVYENDAVADLSAGGVSATFRMRQREDPTNTFTVAATGLNSSGYAYVAITSTAFAIAGEYLGKLYVSGLSSGARTTQPAKKFIVTDRLD